MTSALLETPLSLLDEPRGAGLAFGRGTTLEERLEQALNRVRAERQAECPVCRAPMRLEGAAGRCTGCGSTLA
jgi:tRNA(Ile2) C34 agmatinyltransferase TiaS